MPPASAVFKNEWIYTSTPRICLDVFYSHNFTFPGRSAFLNNKSVVVEATILKKERCEN